MKPWMKCRWTLLVCVVMVSLVAGCQVYEDSEDCDPALGEEWYHCPDDALVPWCTCTDGTWDCDPQPAQACEDIQTCESNSMCDPHSWCDPCATSSCPDCDDCIAGCLLHGCPTEDHPQCRMLRPDCAPGQVSVLSEGCWVCVDAQTCEPPVGRNESCDDGAALSCDELEPDCPDWEIPSIQDGCWMCVAPQSCRPYAEPGCYADSDCLPEFRCDECARGSCPGCEDCVADCVAHACPTEAEPQCYGLRPDCEAGAVAVVRDGCWQCVDLVDCEPARDASCDDGSQSLCDMIPPVCEEHEILAIQKDCWVCVNPFTCAPWGEAGCAHDGECDPDRWCDPCASGSCPMCPDCVPGCAVHGCPTQGFDELQCAMPRPDCQGGGVAVIREGCWVCVGLDACSPIERDTTCDDGSTVLCDGPTPVCEAHEILAVQMDCYLCVNPASCAPWGQAGCEDDAGCGPDETCDPCGTASCPDCDDCVFACRRHGCSTETELNCFCARPDCGLDAVSVIDQGCWICVDAQSCEPTGGGC